MTHRTEKWVFAAIVAATMSINWATIERAPTVWIDEVTYTDPGVNLALGQGFTSSVWYSNSKEEIWSGNAPLYPLMIAGWVRVFGFGIKEVRSLNCVLIVLAVAAVWWGLIRSRLFEKSGTRLAVVVLLLAGYGPTFIYRSGRPDTLLVLLFSLIFLGCCCASTFWRVGLVATASFLIPFSGLSGLPYLALCGVLWLVVTKFGRPYEVLVAGAAAAAGVAVLFASYSALGIWADFRESTSAHTTLSKGFGAMLQHWGTTLRGLRGDPSLVALLGGLVSLNFLVALFKHCRVPRVSLVLLVFALLVPLCMMMLGVFPIYYAWMAFIPAVFAWALWYESPLEPGRGRIVRHALVLLAVVVVAVGLPLRTVLAVSQWAARDYRPVELLCAAVIKSGEVVYCDPQAYYAAKRLGGQVFSGSYFVMITEEEKRSVDVLVIDPERFDEETKLLGGRWERVASEASVVAPRSRFLDTYNLAAWRRVRD